MKNLFIFWIIVGNFICTPYAIIAFEVTTFFLSILHPRKNFVRMPLIGIVKAFILSWLCSWFRSKSISIIEGIKILLKPSLVLSNTFFFKYLECKVLLISSKVRLWSSYIIVLRNYEHKNLARNIIELLLDVNPQLWGL